MNTTTLERPEENTATTATTRMLSAQEAAIESGKIKIVPDVLASGNGGAADGLMGQLARVLPGVDLNGLVGKQGAVKEG